MVRRLLFIVIISVTTLITVSVMLSPSSLAQEWEIGGPRGTLRVVDLFSPTGSVLNNYTEGLVTVDRDNNYVPCLAKDWRWVDDCVIEFKLRRGVFFHNGEEFKAEVVRVNWLEYKKMESPRLFRFTEVPDETTVEVIDEYTVRFTFPEPDGLAFVRLRFFVQIAPAFFAEHKFEEKNWGYFMEAGLWGTGPFKFVEGNVRWAKPSDRLVLEAYEDYWDPRYPKVKKVIFDNTLLGDREEAMRLCREKEGVVDIVSLIRPIDTLKVAESKFAKVVKSKDVTLLFGAFNQRKKGSKWRDIRLRKAVNYAINRKELWSNAAKGNAYNLGGFIPSGEYGHNPDLVLYTYDTTKARSLLAEAGYPKGFDVKVITHEAWRLEARIISKMLERVGLNVDFKILEWPEFVRSTYIPALDKPPEEQEWDIFITDCPDWLGHPGASFLAWATDEGDWRWNEYDPIHEKMWKDMVRTVDREKQEEKIRKMVEYNYYRAWVFSIYSPLTLYAVNKEVTFVPQKCRFLRLKETSVTENHWSVRGKDN
jgi:ABC-type transport system substrate-binding protein